MNNTKKQRKTIEWERPEISLRNWRYQGNVSCKNGHDEGQKWPRTNRSREIKKRQIEYKELYKKGHNDLDDHNGIVVHLEPDIMQCEINQALENIIRNKASRCDRIPAELFKILKDDAVKVLLSRNQRIWKTQQWPQDQKRSVFTPIPKEGNAKECSNYCTKSKIL